MDSVHKLIAFVSTSKNVSCEYFLLMLSTKYILITVEQIFCKLIMIYGFATKIFWENLIEFYSNANQSEVKKVFTFFYYKYKKVLVS